MAGIPVGVKDDDDVTPGDVEPEPAGLGRDEEEEDVRVRVEIAHQIVAHLGLRFAVQATVDVA